MIECFRGKHAFLSNFWPGGQGTLEHKYQAAKARTPEERAKILRASTPGRAKRLGRHTVLRPHWEEIKVSVMLGLLRDKFAPGTDCARWLLDTGDEALVEGNAWGDRFWGVCEGTGENHLGCLLMQVRGELRELLEDRL